MFFNGYIMEFKYELLKFTERDDFVRCHFMKNWYFDIPKANLNALGKWSITDSKSIILDFEDADIIIKRLIDDGLSNLTNLISGNETIYVHKGSGIPLIGNNAFGLVDRGSTLIEIKPVTSCNLKCAFCSVGEGSDAKSYDFLVEADYLVEELKKILEEKGLVNESDKVEAHFSCHGEPLLYGDMVYLVSELSKIPAVTVISADTNGTLLNEKIVDELAEAGMTRLNMSLHSLNQERADKLSGKHINLDHLKKIAEYIAKHPKINLLIAPVWVNGMNNDDIPDLIKYAKKLGVQIGIQNNLNYKSGRNAAKQVSWDEFYDWLGKFEKELDYKLLLNPLDFNIRKSKMISKPFRKSFTVDAEIICHGHNPDEMLAKADGRTITLPKCFKKIGSRVRVKINRDKHNIFYGEVL